MVFFYVTIVRNVEERRYDIHKNACKEKGIGKRLLYYL